MAKLRIFELARDLGVGSKDVLSKCRAEGLDIKNHMSTLSAGLAATIREWFSDAAVGTAVETTAHVDVKEARKRAKKARRKKKVEPVVEAPAEETAPETPAVEEPATLEAVAPDEVVEAPGEGEVPEQQVQDITETEPQAVEVEAEKAPETEEKSVEEPEITEPEAEVEEPQEETEEPEKPKIMAVGPQVVPKPATLRGPRVIRVEKPDFVSSPPPRRTPSGPRTPRPGPAAAAAAGVPPVSTSPAKRGKGRGAVSAEEEKKKTRRSPRRRGGGGRNADSGATGAARIKEWRDKDLAERSVRLAAAGGGHRRRRPTADGRKISGGPTIKVGQVEIDEPISVKSLSAATGIKSVDIIKKLMAAGTLATVNQIINQETAEMIVADYEIELVINRARTAEEELMDKIESRAAGELTSRAPVVTFLGHVDHGKTSLLDHIRSTAVASGEAGGITQHIGAYRHDQGDRHVVFLDTPGHEAFTAMRARGANMTDVVVLVVAADDGVMPQTIEAINHAKAAKVPILVALNKIDVPNANIQRALGQLAEHDLQPHEWGGNTEVIKTSAITGEGMDTLVETLSLEAELLELRADPQAAASGYVVEAEMKPGLGVVATLLVRDGTLRVGDILLAGGGYGRVRRVVDSHGKIITEAGPATPVEVSGLSEVPQAGDRFFVTEDIEEARAVAEDRKQRTRQASLAGTQKVTLENLFSHIEAGQVDELPIIIKADVQGSVEALTASLNKLSTDEIRLNIIHTAVGGISTGDVTLAEASNAIIIGFNVITDAAARQMCEQTGVDIRLYRVIYEILDDIRKAMEEGLEPEIREEVVAHAEVRQVFKVSRLGTIAGCFVTDGTVQRNSRVRVTRDNIVIEDNRTLDSLKRFKDDAKEVRSSMECGLKIAGYDDIKEGDILEFYKQVEIARKL